MQSLGQHKYGILHFLSKFLWKLCLATHWEGRGHDVLPMLYPIPIHNYLIFYSERILIAVYRSLNTVIGYFEVSSCLLCLCPQLKPVYYTHVPQYYNKQLPM